MAYILYWTADTLYYFNPDECDETELNKICIRISHSPGVINSIVYWGLEEHLPPFAVCTDSDGQA